MVGTGLLALAGSEARAADTLRILLERPVDAAAAPLAVAINRGLFRAEDIDIRLTVSNGTGNGRPEIFTRLAAKDGDIAYADINALMQYRDLPDAADLKAIHATFSASGYAIVARRSRDIQTLADLDDNILGFSDGDLAAAFWPALARLNGIKQDTVRLQRIGKAVREPMLSAGQVDAITGFSYLAPINLRDRGIPASDLVVFRYADYGITAYGPAMIANPAYATNNADVLRRFLRVLNAAIVLTIADPVAAVDDVMAQMDGGQRAIELERLRALINEGLLALPGRSVDSGNPDSINARLGDIDPARFASAIAQLAEGVKFREMPVTANIFDGSFLPPPSDGSPR